LTEKTRIDQQKEIDYIKQLTEKIKDLESQIKKLFYENKKISGDIENLENGFDSYLRH
jgi:cell division protein FtsB